MPKNPRFRGWCFTLNNYTDEELDRLKKLKCDYIIMQHEVSKTGTPHIQGYMEFENARTMLGVKNVTECRRMHLEPRHGTPQQASDYCRKQKSPYDKPLFEKGEVSHQGQRNDLIELKKEIDEGKQMEELAEEFPSLVIRYHKGIQKLIELKQKHRTEPPTVIWLYGKTGIGKTRTACEYTPDSFYMKDNTKWWDNYTQQKTIVIDDFDGIWENGFKDFLRLLDRYPYQGQTKGGYIKINSPTIFITAEHKPKKYYSSYRLSQIARRIDIVSMPL